MSKFIGFDFNKDYFVNNDEQRLSTCGLLTINIIMENQDVMNNYEESIEDSDEKEISIMPKKYSLRDRNIKKSEKLYYTAIKFAV